MDTLKWLRNIIASMLALLVALLVALDLSTQYSLAAPVGGTVGTGTPASCTEAVLDAAMAGGGSVNFNCGPNPYTITLTSGIVVTTSTSVDGGGKISLSGGHTAKVFLDFASNGLTLTNITLADGQSVFGGCVTVVSGALTTVNTVIRDCHSTTGGGFYPGDGGALTVLNGSLSMSNTQVLNNVADVNGGGIYLNGGTHTLDHVSVIGNRADITDTGSGGGIYVQGPALLNVRYSQINSNHIGFVGYGGGIAVYTGTLDSSNVALNNNLGGAVSVGGGLSLQGGTAFLDYVTLSGNSARLGGAIDSAISYLSVSNSTLSNNVTTDAGGGIATNIGNLYLSHVDIRTNFSGGAGGGLELRDTNATVADSTIVGNSAQEQGGGIHHYLGGELRLNHVTLDSNRAKGGGILGGGGIASDTGSLLISDSTLQSNTSAGPGGGINDLDFTMFVTNTTFSANAASTGGAIYVPGDNPPLIGTVMTLTNVTVKDNRAASGGGLYIGSDPSTFVFLKNTIIADSPSGSNCQGQAVTFAKYSLSTDASCALAGTGDLNNTPALLLPLANVVGPTETHLPKAGSPAVNAVLNNDCPGADQRGVVRPQGTYCDMGAVERQASDPSTVPVLYLPLLAH